MRNKTFRLLVDFCVGAMPPGGADERQFIRAQTISVALILATTVAFAAALLYSPVSRALTNIHLATGVFYALAYGYFRLSQDAVGVTRASCAAAYAVIVMVNAVCGGVSSPALSWFILPAIASALVLGWKDGWFWIVAGAIASTGLFLAGQTQRLPPSEVPADYIATMALFYVIAFSLVVGALFSFWVARSNLMERELKSSLARSEYDTFLANLFAELAIAANGSMGFEEAGPYCLELVCRAKGWCGAHLWRVGTDHRLQGGRVCYVSETHPELRAYIERGLDIDGTDTTANVAAETGIPIVGVEISDDPRFRDAARVPTSVLAWPIEVDGKVELVLEFFSAKLIVLDEEVRGILRHVAVQLAHVRLRESVQDRTELMAYTDAVTGLPNRTGFEQLFAQKLKEARRKRVRLALMFIDLDGFKRVNDSLGHATGDRLLKIVGKRLSEQVRGSDFAAKLVAEDDTIAARLGGDEFTLVLGDVEDTDAVAAAAQRFLDVLARPIDVGVQDVNIGASIGIAVYPEDGTTMSDLMRLSDAAMYEAKSIPGNQFRFATPALNDSIQRRLWLETELHRALKSNDLKLSYVPIAAALTGRVIGNEVMLRWPHRDGEIPVHEFLAVATSSNLIIELGYWLLEQTCRAIADQRWRAKERPRVCIDVPPRLLQHPQFVQHVTEILQRHEFPRGLLEFEFANVSGMLDNAICRENLKTLHTLGVRVVLDNFGNGYSSLIDFVELPVWRIKLDRGFLERVNLADGNRSMGRALVAMAHSMGVETTVFAVHDPADVARMRELGVDAIQGRAVGGETLTPFATGASLGFAHERNAFVDVDVTA